MAWRRAVTVAVAVAVALLARDANAQDACQQDQFSVSVLDDPQIHCLASRPCSGVYGPEGLVTGVGACPSGTGCALLPHNPSVMGCVVAGRADVSYVNADGSLTRGGQVVEASPTTTPNTDSGDKPESGDNTDANSDNNANGNNNGNTNDSTNDNTNGNANGNANGNNAAAPANGTASASPAPTVSTNVPTPGHVKPGGKDTSASGDQENAPAKGSASSSGKSSQPGSKDGSKDKDGSTAGSSGGLNTVATKTPTASPTPQANQQNALDDISGDAAKTKRGSDIQGGMGLGSIIAVVVGCLAVVAIIAGVFVLRKKKEQAADTPVGAMEDYGNGCVTPKENVLLL